MKKKEYTCEMCGETYNQGQSDAEAQEESKAIWGKYPESELGIVCDDCFNDIIANLFDEPSVAN